MKSDPPNKSIRLKRTINVQTITPAQCSIKNIKRKLTITAIKIESSITYFAAVKSC